MFSRLGINLVIEKGLTVAHNIETTFYVGQSPWHGLGTYVGDAPIASEEAIVKAGLDWQVDLRPVYAAVGDGQSALCGNNKAVVRATDNSVLGIVGNRYTPLQNKE